MAKIKSWRTLTKNIIQSIKWCWDNLILPCIKLLSRIFGYLGKIITRDKQFSFVFFITVALIIGLLLFCIVPTSQSFEGNLLVNSIGFTSTESDRLLLKNVQNLQEITISGIQKFTLSGTFSSLSNPEIAKQKQLEIELPDSSKPKTD